MKPPIFIFFMICFVSLTMSGRAQQVPNRPPNAQIVPVSGAKIFMPNREYKRILHTGVESPSAKQLQQEQYTVATPPQAASANLAHVAPKYRQNTAAMIASIQDKLQYAKAAADTPQNRAQIAQLEQQIGTLYEQQSHEKECVPK